MGTNKTSKEAKAVARSALTQKPSPPPTTGVIIQKRRRRNPDTVKTKDGVKFQFFGTRIRDTARILKRRA